MPYSVACKSGRHANQGLLAFLLHGNGCVNGERQACIANDVMSRILLQAIVSYSNAEAEGIMANLRCS